MPALQIYGHRGARAEAPENTLASFRRAIDAGVTRVELDLHLSADQQLMVIHDPTLKRTTGLHGKVAQHSADYLRQLDARHALPGWPEPCPIPSLDQLFAACPEIRHYQLEVKSGSTEQARRVLAAILQLVEQFGLQERVTVTSSSRTLLRQAHASNYPLPTGLVEEYGLLDPVKSARRYGCRMLVLNWTLCSPALLARAQQAGLHVSVWTVNEPELMQHLAGLGVNSLITDRPTLAMQLFPDAGS